MVHLETNFGALRNNMASLEAQRSQATQRRFWVLDILKQFRYF
jgi:hypothetical protein